MVESLLKHQFVSALSPTHPPVLPQQSSKVLCITDLLILALFTEVSAPFPCVDSPGREWYSRLAAEAGMLRFWCLARGPLVPSSEEKRWRHIHVSSPLLAGGVTIALQHGRPIASVEISNCVAGKSQLQSLCDRR